MSLLKSKKTKALAILAMTMTMLLSFTGSTPVYAALQGPSQTAIKLAQSSKVNSTTTAKPAKDVKVTLNGKAVTLSDPILNDNGSTLIPVRAVADLLGIEVGYDATYKIAIASDEDTTLEIPIGLNKAVNNGKVVTIPNTKSITANSRTYLPLRFIAEQLSIGITYISQSRTVAITTGDSAQTQIPTPTPTPSTPVAGKLSPQDVIDQNKSVIDVDESYFKNFESVEQIKKLFPQFSDKACNNIYNLNGKYVVATRDITSQDFKSEGNWLTCEKSYLPFGANMISNEIIVFKDGTFTEDLSFGDTGKTLEDVAYYAYSKTDRFMIVKLGKVDLSSFLY